MRFQLVRISSALALAAASLCSGAAQAATYYVSTTGNNQNPGTEERPWRSVAHAVSTMVAGDTTFVTRGTYNEGTIWFKRSGTQSAPIRLLNYPGHAPKIVFIDPGAGQRIYIQNSAGINKPIGWISIEGFELTNGHDGIKWHSLHDSTIRRNWIHHNEFMGILGGGSARVLIDRNILNHNGSFTLCAQEAWRCNQHHAMYVSGSAVTITNNIMYDMLAFGIHQNGSASSAYDPASHPSVEFSGAANWVVSNNTIAYNAYRGGYAVWGGACDGTRIENNIFYENGVNRPSTAPQGIEFVGAGGSTGITVRNNHFYASGSGSTIAIGSGAPADLVSSGNVINVSPPAFVNGGSNLLPASPDFRLTAQSPAIDKGLNPNLPSARVDYAGGARPQGTAYDIGAYEFGAVPGNNPPPLDTPPAPPNDLIVK